MWPSESVELVLECPVYFEVEDTEETWTVEVNYRPGAPGFTAADPGSCYPPEGSEVHVWRVRDQAGRTIPHHGDARRNLPTDIRAFLADVEREAGRAYGRRYGGVRA